MNRFYLIIPLVFLTLFGGVYWYHSQQSDADAQARAAAVAAAESAAKAQQSAAEAKARAEVASRAAARVEAERKKQELLHEQWSAETARIAAETEGYQKQATLLRAELAGVEQQLSAVRHARIDAAAKGMELAREVELLRIAKRNAELEVQRTTEILVRRATQSSLVPNRP
jgi:hypothetical protein